MHVILPVLLIFLSGYILQRIFISLLLLSVFGVYFASRGQHSAKTAVQSILKMPANYAVLLAVALQQLQPALSAGSVAEKSDGHLSRDAFR
ncbi:hypothetical protein [Effusibacillus pohliae]|uniref:hypothetical protein n=1 Tax=Effusibacillus pohliae TaxID=232270 RepID=UPI001FE106A4|nr:hypothetical protein [Effusibacillus pohliae]